MSDNEDENLGNLENRENLENNDYETIENKINETPLPEIDDEFRKNIIKCKDILYNVFVLSIPLNDEKSQDNTILNNYLKSLTTIYNVLQPNYLLSNSVDWNKAPLNTVPNEARPVLSQIVTFYSDFLNKNQGAHDRLPYISYIKNSLYTYPFNQTDKFE